MIVVHDPGIVAGRYDLARREIGFMLEGETGQLCHFLRRQELIQHNTAPRQDFWPFRNRNVGLGDDLRIVCLPRMLRLGHLDSGMLRFRPAYSRMLRFRSAHSWVLRFRPTDSGMLRLRPPYARMLGLSRRCFYAWVLRLNRRRSFHTGMLRLRCWRRRLYSGMLRLDRFGCAQKLCGMGCRISAGQRTSLKNAFYNARTQHRKGPLSHCLADCGRNHCSDHFPSLRDPRHLPSWHVAAMWPVTRVRVR